MSFLKLRITHILCFLSISLPVFSQDEIRRNEDEVLNFKNLFDANTKNGISCYRIPALVTAPNGDLIAAIDERVPSCDDLRGNPDINIVLRRSADNGKTWSAIERVIDYPSGKSASDPSMIVDNQTNTVFLFFNSMDLDNEKNIYYLNVTQSLDNGKSWSIPVDITSQIAKPEWYSDFKFITSGRGVQTRSGKLLHTLVNLKRGIHLFASDDHGENWYLINTPILPGDESKVIELADGSWMINSRVNNTGLRFVHTSSDEGRTWLSRPDSSLIDPGCNASIIRYASQEKGEEKNIILFSNAEMRNERKNLTVKISYDEGRSWSMGQTIYPGSSAYSTMTILANGDIGLLFEKDNYTNNTFVKFTLEWLTDGNDQNSK